MRSNMYGQTNKSVHKRDDHRSLQGGVCGRWLQWFLHQGGNPTPAQHHGDKPEPARLALHELTAKPVLAFAGTHDLLVCTKNNNQWDNLELIGIEFECPEDIGLPQRSICVDEWLGFL